jgi:hypothetical protein
MVEGGVREVSYDFVLSVCDLVDCGVVELDDLDIELDIANGAGRPILLWRGVMFARCQTTVAVRPGGTLTYRFIDRDWRFQIPHEVPDVLTLKECL